MNDITLPIRAAPYRHQQEAFTFATRLFTEDASPGAALLMEMGTGKTITSIAIAGALWQTGRVKRALIVAPLSILGVWQEEFAKFADFAYTLQVLTGSTEQKAQALAHSVKAFKGGKLSLGVEDIGVAAAADLTGASVDNNGVLIASGEDDGCLVAVGFRALKPDNRYRYFWLYRTKFAVPSTNLATKGDSIQFQTPTIEATIMRRNKPDASGKHPWKSEVTEGDPGVAAVIAAWFTQVYEPQYA